MKRLSAAALVGAALVFPAALSAGPANSSERSLRGLRGQVAVATVALPELSCAGAVAVSRAQVVTTAHCVPEDTDEVTVVLGDGETLQATIDHLDREHDLALLHLPREVQVKPLELASDLPKRGDRVLFVGRTDRPSRTQVVRIDKLAPCPSLPDVSNALFTSVTARPGDSGAPLVDSQARIVGLIHGGARCQIAVPTTPLVKVVSGAEPAQPGSSVTFHVTTDPAGGSGHFGPFKWQKTKDGFQFEFHFNWNWDSTKKP